MRDRWELDAVKRALLLLARLTLGGVLVYAGVAKAIDPRSFAEDLANYQLLPAALIPLVAVTLPFVEITAAIALFVPGWRRAGALLALTLLALFTLGVGQALARRIDLSCGCFGGGERPADLWLIARNLALCGAAYFLYRGGAVARGDGATAS